MERKATAVCSLVLPDVTECTLALPVRQLQLAKQSHTVVGLALPPGVLAPQRASLPPRQVRAVRLLLAGHGVCHVAEALGVCRHTVSRWMKDPVFRAEVRGHVTAAVPLPAGRPARR